MAEKLTAHRFIRGNEGFRQRPGWCSEHGDFAWQFEDQSIECLHCASLEMTNDSCVFVPGELHLPRGTIKRASKARSTLGASDG